MSALPPSATTQPTESAEPPARPTKSGMPPSDHADAFQAITLSEESAPNATQRLKSTTKDFNAVIALRDTKKCQDKAATESADLSAAKIKTGSQIDVFASPDSS